MAFSALLSFVTLPLGMDFARPSPDGQKLNIAGVVVWVILGIVAVACGIGGTASLVLARQRRKDTKAFTSLIVEDMQHFMGRHATDPTAMPAGTAAVVAPPPPA